MRRKGICHRMSVWTVAAAIGAAAAISMTCGGQVPLTAPSGAELTITANPTAIPVSNGVSTITVVGFKGADDGGGPLADGTQIFFTTNVGVIEERVEMQSGRAVAFLRSNGRAGLATVEARSGAGITATLANPVLVGNAQGINILVTAHPATVQPPDFTSDIVATVFDNDNNMMPGVPLIFSTSAGSLASQGSILRTNAAGQAMDRLTLANESSATVTVSSGAVSGSVTVGRETVRNPVVASVFPASGELGETLNVTITGLNFQPGATVSFGQGVRVNSVSFISSTLLQVNIAIDPGARIETQGRTVTVTNPDGGIGSLTDAFRIGTNIVSPIILNVVPTSSPNRDPVPVNMTITGENFQMGATVRFEPGGINVQSFTVNSSTQISVVFLVDVLVNSGETFDVVVRNPDGGEARRSDAFTAQ